MIRALLLVAILIAAFPARTSAGAALQPRLGTAIDPDLAFTDATGRHDRLVGFTAGKPALVLPGYHRCPGLCGVAERDLAEALAATELPTDSYAVLFASIDPSETPADATAARSKLADAAPDVDLANWHFVTASSPAVAARLESALGIAVQPKERGLYVHPIAVVALTADGRLSRVLSGLDYTPRDLRLALIEASQNRLGTLVEHVLLLCGGFNQAAGRYTDAVMIGVRAGGILALIVLAGGLVLMVRPQRA
jgi:protein SCO1/2